ncbi:MAG: hypothetical protein CMN30_14720 [Sandaracinus sp.]|nr:hypothetical protein [Sandaracinus sp.]
MLAVLAGCADGGLGVSVDLKSDWQPGRQFVGVITRVGHGLGDAFVAEGGAEQVVATANQDYLEGVRIAEFDGLTRGELTVRVELLTLEGDRLALRDTVLDLRGDHALTVLITSSCADVACPGADDPAELTACFGGRCVDPSCSPENLEACGPSTCETDAECGGASECSFGACVEGECLLRADESVCGTGLTCDIFGGCVLADGVDGGPMCPETETACDDGMDDDCDGLTDCADPDCEELTCDDGSVCTEGDVCRMGVCGGAALDCDDGDGCTDDVCDPELGCSNPPNTAPCDDGSWCNGTDSCRDGLCQDHAAAPCAEFCNESTMACEMCAADGDCGAPSTGEWSACTGFSGTCDETGTRTRPVMTPRCTAGACSVEVTTESQSCTRSTTGDPCGSTIRGDWGNCGGYSGACDTTGTQTRDVTTRTCRSGSCQRDTERQSRSCSRTVTNGKSCGSGRVCCSNSCVSLSSNRHCGACRVDCSSRGLTCASTGSGGRACRGCGSNTQCENLLNSAATCYTTGGSSFCNCQCGGGASVCAGGGCGGNFFCHDEPGHNYCSPNR